MSAAHVYRVYDGEQRLIYVGATRFLGSRLDAHRRTTWWAYQVAKVTAKVYPSISAARAAERAAIASENPRWNIIGRWQRRFSWSQADYLDYVHAVHQTDASGSYLTYANVQHIDRVRAYYQMRFGEELPVSDCQRVAEGKVRDRLKPGRAA